MKPETGEPEASWGQTGASSGASNGITLGTTVCTTVCTTIGASPGNTPGIRAGIRTSICPGTPPDTPRPISPQPVPGPATRPPWRVTAEDPLHPDALRLRASLDQALQQITGDTGQSSFAVDDLTQAGAVWLMCRDPDGQALGCAALRPLPLPPDWPGHEQMGGIRPAAEIKRMHALPGTRGVGAALMHALIEAAHDQGLGWLLLSTRRVNTAAVAFYARHGFAEVPAYGRYAGRAVSVCMGRRLR